MSSSAAASGGSPPAPIRNWSGFVNVAWDGGSHAFLLDIVVDARVQRQGIGRRLVERAAVMAREAGADWLHVDFEPGLHAFYDACGFEPSDAGLLSLRQD